MTTNRNLNKQRRIGLKLAIGSEKINYEDPRLYPSFPESAQPQQLSLSDVSQETKPPKTKKKKHSLDELNDMERRILDLYNNSNKAVADNDAILDTEIWLQEGLREVLKSGSLAVFLHWFMFDASSAATIERTGRDLRSPKDGPPHMIASEGTRKSRAAREKAWHHHWSIKDGGTVKTEHELHRFDRRDGWDKHAYPEKENTESVIPPKK